MGQFNHGLAKVSTLERYPPFNTGVFAWREFTVDSKLYCLNMEMTF